MASSYAGAAFVSVFLGIALLTIGIEIIVVGVTGTLQGQNRIG